MRPPIRRGSQWPVGSKLQPPWIPGASTTTGERGNDGVGAPPGVKISAILATCPEASRPGRRPSHVCFRPPAPYRHVDAGHERGVHGCGGRRFDALAELLAVLDAEDDGGYSVDGERVLVGEVGGGFADLGGDGAERRGADVVGELRVAAGQGPVDGVGECAGLDGADAQDGGAGGVGGGDDLARPGGLPARSRPAGGVERTADLNATDWAAPASTPRRAAKSDPPPIDTDDSLQPHVGSVARLFSSTCVMNHMAGLNTIHRTSMSHLLMLPSVRAASASPCL